jgi:branched-chain amino acid aminotransferase
MMVSLNGSLLPADEARIASTDRGFLLGDGLFETMCVRHGSILRLDAHLERLRRGAGFLGIPVPADDLPSLLGDVLSVNGLVEASLRLTLTRGRGPRGVLPPAAPSPTLLITSAPKAAPLPPAHCVIATTTRRNEHSPLSRIKSLNYLDAIIARQEAASRGGDEAILLNGAGRVAEASAANIFVVEDGKLVTPPISEGALPGVTRAAIVARGAVERSVAPAELSHAQGIFLSSSLGLREVLSIDGLAVPAMPADVLTELSGALWPE